MVSASVVVSSLLQHVKELRYPLTSRHKQRTQRKKFVTTKVQRHKVSWIFIPFFYEAIDLYILLDPHNFLSFLCAWVVTKFFRNSHSLPSKNTTFASFGAPVGESQPSKFAIQLEEDETAWTVTCIAEALRISKAGSSESEQGQGLVKLIRRWRDSQICAKPEITREVMATSTVWVRRGWDWQHAYKFR